MPHITVEVPAPLAARIDWRRCFVDLHKALSDGGFGRLHDLRAG